MIRPDFLQEILERGPKLREESEESDITTSGYVSREVSYFGRGEGRAERKTAESKLFTTIHPLDGAPGAIPTRDLPLRRRTLYATELRERELVNRKW
jgi:hypothetical protein